MRRRADDAIRAGMLTSARRIVAVVALPRPVLAMVAAARVRLNAMTATTFRSKSHSRPQPIGGSRLRVARLLAIVGADWASV